MVCFLVTTSKEGQDSGGSNGGTKSVEHEGKLKRGHCIGIVGIIVFDILVIEALSGAFV